MHRQLSHCCLWSWGAIFDAFRVEMQRHGLSGSLLAITDEERHHYRLFRKDYIPIANHYTILRAFVRLCRTYDHASIIAAHYY
jgi:hypothetical protein